VGSNPTAPTIFPSEDGFQQMLPTPSKPSSAIAKATQTIIVIAPQLKPVELEHIESKHFSSPDRF
jgi:hypothetical protein